MVTLSRWLLAEMQHGSGKLAIFSFKHSFQSNTGGRMSGYSSGTLGSFQILKTKLWDVPSLQDTSWRCFVHLSKFLEGDLSLHPQRRSEAPLRSHWLLLPSPFTRKRRLVIFGQQVKPTTWPWWDYLTRCRRTTSIAAATRWAWVPCGFWFWVAVADGGRGSVMRLGGPTHARTHALEDDTITRLVHRAIAMTLLCRDYSWN